MKCAVSVLIRFSEKANISAVFDICVKTICMFNIEIGNVYIWNVRDLKLLVLIFEESKQWYFIFDCSCTKTNSEKQHFDWIQISFAWKLKMMYCNFSIYIRYMVHIAPILIDKREIGAHFIDCWPSWCHHTLNNFNDCTRYFRYKPGWAYAHYICVHSCILQ